MAKNKQNDIVEEQDFDEQMKDQEPMVEEKHVEKAEKVDRGQEKIDKINKVKRSEDEILKALKFKDYAPLVSNCYTELDANIQMVIKRFSYGVIIEGKGGTGKTYRVLNKSINALGETEVKYVDSFTTPTALYVTLCENKDKALIILDDCAGMMNNPKILAMLKGALWHINDGHTRIVNYGTTKPPKDEYDEPLPRTIEVNSRIIIITNSLNDDNPHVKAILSRVNRIRVNVPRKELLNILQQVIKKKYHNLTVDERQEVLEYLETNTSIMTEDLNIRTLLRMMDYRAWAKNNVDEDTGLPLGDAWKPLCLLLLQRDDRIALVEKLLNDVNIKTEEERYSTFVELTGESQATYYRLKGKVKRQMKQIEKMEKKIEKTAEKFADKVSDDSSGEGSG